MAALTREDRIRGLIFGLAAGDKNGGPFRMMVRLAESLIECGEYNDANVWQRCEIQRVHHGKISKVLRYVMWFEGPPKGMFFPI